MRAFGMSAFLKLLCMNERPRRTEIRSRLVPTGDAFDYHRSLRLRIKRYLMQGFLLTDVMDSIASIGRASEQKSVKTGLENLEIWRANNPGELLAYEPVKYEGPGGILKVRFTPDFGIKIGDAGVAVHVWNTAKPKLDPRMVYAALSLFTEPYEELDNCPDDIAILSLPDMQLYRLSEAGRAGTIGASVAERIEDAFREENDGLGLPPLNREPGKRAD